MADRVLLDTHALIYWAVDPSRLSASAARLIEDGETEVYVSPVSAMEIATKVRIGKLAVAGGLAKGFGRQMAQRGVIELPLNCDHAELAGSYPSPHNDPWDRLLAAQASIEDLTLLTNDPQMSTFPVRTLW